MTRRTLKQSAYKATPYEAWNAFVGLIAMESSEDLTETQRHAHFAFWYDSELQNGGHLQYFENQRIQYGGATIHLDATLRALQVIGADSQLAVLSSAAARWGGKHRRVIQTLEEYAEMAIEGEYDDLDKAYYDCEPTVTDLLEKYFATHFAEFVELVQ